MSMLDELITSLVTVSLRTLSFMTFPGHARGLRFQLHAGPPAYFVNRPPVLANLTVFRWDVSAANPAGRTVDLVISHVGLRAAVLAKTKRKRWEVFADNRT